MLVVWYVLVLSVIGSELSMRQDLCTAALSFAFDTLRSGGHFVAKFYQGAEDKLLEKKLKKLFEKVHRDKPEASRKVVHFIHSLHRSYSDRSLGVARRLFCCVAPERDADQGRRVR